MNETQPKAPQAVERCWPPSLTTTQAAEYCGYRTADPAEDITYFDTSEHETCTAEEPNSLSVDEARIFVECMRDEFPQHFSMTYLLRLVRPSNDGEYAGSAPSGARMGAGGAPSGARMGAGGAQNHSAAS